MGGVARDDRGGKIEGGTPGMNPRSKSSGIMMAGGGGGISMADELVTE